jgi:hypothetical protein
VYDAGASTPFLMTSTVADSTGAFVVDSIPGGVFDVRVKAAQNLARQVNGVIFPVATANGEAAAVVEVSLGILLAGDTDNNDVVDVVDFSLLRAAFGTTTVCAGANPLTVPCADFDASGNIDVVDFSLLRSNFGRIGPIL